MGHFLHKITTHRANKPHNAHTHTHPKWFKPKVAKCKSEPKAEAMIALGGEGSDQAEGERTRLEDLSQLLIGFPITWIVPRGTLKCTKRRQTE